MPKRTTELIAEPGDRVEVQPCCRCGAMPSDFLCDFTLGWWAKQQEFTMGNWSAMFKEPVAKKRGELYMDEERLHEAPTCDAPLCGKCTTKYGPIFYCGDESDIEWKDYCPVHATDDAHVFSVGPKRFTLPEEVDAERAAAWAANRTAYRAPLVRLPQEPPQES